MKKKHSNISKTIFQSENIEYHPLLQDNLRARIEAYDVILSSICSTPTMEKVKYRIEKLCKWCWSRWFTRWEKFRFYRNQ